MEVTDGRVARGRGQAYVTVIAQAVPPPTQAPPASRAGSTGRRRVQRHQDRTERRRERRRHGRVRGSNHQRGPTQANNLKIADNYDLALNKVARPMATRSPGTT